MRFLFINQYYLPDIAATAQQMADVCERLAREGHEVHVLAGDAFYDEHEERTPLSEEIAGVRVHRVHVSRSGRRRFRDRLRGYLSFYWRAFLHIHTVPRPDVVVTLTTPPLIALLGVWLKFWRRSSFVYWVMDIYPDIAIRAEVLSKLGPARGVWSSMARLCYYSSDCTVVLGRDMREVMLRKQVAEERIAVVPNWAGEDDFVPTEPGQNTFRRELAGPGDFLVMYSGNLGICHLYEEIIACARDMVDEPTVKFAFVGGGKMYPNLIEALAEFSPRVRFLPYQPREKLSESLSAPDAHLISLAGKYDGLLVPSKIYGIMAAGRPAIMIGSRHSEAARVILENEAGLVVPEGKPEELRAAVLRLRDDPTLARRLGENARAAFLRSYTRGFQTGRFLGILHDLEESNLSGLRPATHRAQDTRMIRLVDGVLGSRIVLVILALLLAGFAYIQSATALSTTRWEDSFRASASTERPALIENVPDDHKALGASARFLVDSVFPPNAEMIDPLLERRLALAPLDSTTWFLLARTRIMAGRRDEARPALAHADALNPAYPRERLKSLQQWMLLGDAQSAEALARDIAQFDITARLEAADALLAAGYSASEVFEILHDESLQPPDTARLFARLAGTRAEKNEALFNRLPAAVMEDSDARRILGPALLSPVVYTPSIEIWKREQPGHPLVPARRPDGTLLFELANPGLTQDPLQAATTLGWQFANQETTARLDWEKGQMVVTPSPNERGARSQVLYKFVVPGGLPPIRAQLAVTITPIGAYDCRLVLHRGGEEFRGTSTIDRPPGENRLYADMPVRMNDEMVTVVLERSRRSIHTDLRESITIGPLEFETFDDAELPP